MSLKVCSLASGSSGNATYLASDATSILIDSGCSAREVTLRLAQIGVDPANLDAILITHAHVDHYRSAGTLSRRYGIPVFVDPSTARVLVHRGRWTSWKQLRETQPISPRIGDLEILALDTSHGSPDRVGRTVAFVVSNGRRRVGIVTDLGTLPEKTIAELEGLDAILLEANYDEGIIQRKLSDPAFSSDWPYLSWVLGDRGHLSNQQCADALSMIVRTHRCHVFLGHMSVNHHDSVRDNNDFRLASETVIRTLERRREKLPQIHRTYRLGLAPSPPSDLVEI